MSVSIRKKRGKLYLDIYENGTRKWEALHLDITDDKDMNKETMRLAEICRAKRALQVVSGEWGLIDPVAGKKTLYSFIKEMDDSGKHGCKIHQVLKHLKAFPSGNTIQIGQVNKKWIENFQDYLLTFLSGNSAHMYSGAVRQALRKAVRDNIILKSPGDEIANIKLQETDKVFLSIEEIQKLADIPPQTGGCPGKDKAATQGFPKGRLSKGIWGALSAMKNLPWIARFLRWTLGADDALPLEQPDFGMALDMGILAMCHIADSDNRNTAEQIEAAKTGLSQACREGRITHDEFLIGIEHIKCWAVR